MVTDREQPPMDGAILSHSQSCLCDPSSRGGPSLTPPRPGSIPGEHQGLAVIKQPRVFCIQVFFLLSLNGSRIILTPTWSKLFKYLCLVYKAF